MRVRDGLFTRSRSRELVLACTQREAALRARDLEYPSKRRRCHLERGAELYERCAPRRRAVGRKEAKACPHPSYDEINFKRPREPCIRV